MSVFYASISSRADIRLDQDPYVANRNIWIVLHISFNALCSYSRDLLRAGSLHWESLWHKHFTSSSFLVVYEEALAELCLVISSALTPSLPLSHRLGEFILNDYVADKGIPRTTVTEHI